MSDSMIQKNTSFTHLLSSKQSAELDHLANKNYGLSAELLMETAGALSAGKLISYLKQIHGKELKPLIRKPSFSVMVLCGPGNNGADGLVLARHLLSEGFTLKVFLPKFKSQENQPKNPLLEKQKSRLRSIGIDFYSLEDMQKIKHIGQKCILIVDALFGVGLSRNIEGTYAELIKWINLKAKQPVISLDTPSGLDVNTGQIKGQAVKADLTLTFGLAKPGFYLMQGPAHTGEIKVFSIGFPLPLLREKACTHFLIDKYWVSSRLPERKPMDHKACQGHLLVVAGSEGLWGAGALTALSAYRMGAGYVTWATNLYEKSDVIRNIPDVLTKNLSDPDLFKGKTAVAIGPGLKTGEQTKKLLLELKKTKLPVLVDASAFLVCVKENLFPLPSHWVLTPHSGELARLFNITGKQVDQDRCSYAMKASQKTGALLLLKGFYSVLAKNNQCWIIPAGNSALAKAGTGDVLTGFIGALMARSLDTFSAVAVSSFVHGLLAEEWLVKGKDKDSLMANDLRDILPVVLKKLRSLSSG